MGDHVRTGPPSAGGWVALFLGALSLALALCAYQAQAIARFRDPVPDLSARVGETVTVDGITYRLDSFVVAQQLPAKQDPSDTEASPPVRPMAGAALVGTTLTVTVLEPARDLTTVYCDFTLVDGRGRSWVRDYDAEYAAAGPEARVCSGTEENPLRLQRPMPIGIVFMIPQDAAAQIRFRIRLGTDQRLIEFRR